MDSQTFWSALEWFGVLTGLLYLWFEIKQKAAMWVVGIMCSVSYIFVYASARLYADMAFYIYSSSLSVYGFVLWRRRIGGATAQIQYRRLGTRLSLTLAALTAVAYAAISLMLSLFTDSPVPFFDAFTTALSITATWMLAKRYIAHWWWWVAVDGASVALYCIRGLYPTMLLFAFYTVSAVGGYFFWKRRGEPAESAQTSEQIIA